MEQVENFEENADMERQEPRVVKYDYRPEQNLSMVAEEQAGYGKKK